MGIYRILDANFNRTKEGLRVIEEYFRFIENNEQHTKTLKDIRHKITDILLDNSLTLDFIRARDIQTDILSDDYTKNESSRRDAQEVLIINFQRVKESLRVIEEYIKVLDESLGEEFQRIRFALYELEKKIVENISVGLGHAPTDSKDID